MYSISISKIRLRDSPGEIFPWHHTPHPNPGWFFYRAKEWENTRIEEMTSEKRLSLTPETPKWKTEIGEEVWMSFINLGQ